MAKANEMKYIKPNFYIAKSEFLNTISIYNWISSFFLFLSFYSFLALSLDILRLIIAKYYNIIFSNSYSIISLIPIIGMLSTFLYFKGKIVNHNYYLDSCIINLWGYAIISNSAFSIIITKFYIVYFENLPLENLPNFWINAFLISTGVFVTGVILENKIINLMSCIYLILSFLYFIMPEITIVIDDKTISFYTTSYLSHILNTFIYIFLYLYLKKQRNY